MIKIFIIIIKIYAAIIKFCNKYAIIQLNNCLFYKIILNQRINIISLVYLGTLFYSYFRQLFEFNLFEIFKFIILTLFFVCYM